MIVPPGCSRLVLIMPDGSHLEAVIGFPPDDLAKVQELPVDLGPWGTRDWNGLWHAQREPEGFRLVVPLPRPAP